MAIGFLVGVLSFSFFNAGWVFIPLVVLGSLLPDVDHTNSKINRLLPVTRLVPLFFKHRGFFHSIFPALILYGVFWYFDYSWFGLPLALGYLTHLTSDCFTRLGCNLLHPFSTFRVQGFLRTGGVVELLMFVGVLLVDALLVFAHL